MSAGCRFACFGAGRIQKTAFSLAEQYAEGASKVAQEVGKLTFQVMLNNNPQKAAEADSEDRIVFA